MTEQTGGRRVVTNMSLSLDGHYGGPDDPEDMGWVMPYAVTDVARDHLTSLWEPATTALLGRVNAEGFLGFWPTVSGMEGADPRDETALLHSFELALAQASAETAPLLYRQWPRLDAIHRDMRSLARAVGY